ncbi:acetyl-CoA synthetase [archaeon]|nr:acetyl-CoA synthetase [archaeon]|tara:strand:- start:14843 stop:15487 length:645 start_codon:yes stop_codon:yes gene_type:complete
MQIIYTEYQAEEFLLKYKIPVSTRFLTNSYEEVLDAIKKIRFPIDLKIMSTEVLHKSDVGGVRICYNINDVKKEYEEIMSIVKKLKVKKFEGILVQEFKKGKELFIGLKKDDVFGHVIGFGFGGVFTEVIKDVNFRVCPIDDKNAQELIDELKAKSILYGVRGEKPVNIKLLKKILIQISRIPLKHDNLQELDINPIIMHDDKATVVDARLVLG